jgi:hypothetical protein
MRTFVAPAIASFRLSNPLNRVVRMTQMSERAEMIDEQRKRTPGRLCRKAEIESLEAA